MDFLPRAKRACLLACAAGALATAGCGESNSIAPKQAAAVARREINSRSAQFSALAPAQSTAGHKKPAVPEPIQPVAAQPLPRPNRTSRTQPNSPTIPAWPRRLPIVQPPTPIPTWNAAPTPTPSTQSSNSAAHMNIPEVSQKISESSSKSASNSIYQDLANPSPMTSGYAPVYADRTVLRSGEPNAIVAASPDIHSSPSLPTNSTAPPSHEVMAPVAQQVYELTRQGFDLAERGATYAARKQLEQALLITARALDAYEQGDRHSTMIAHAWRALEEASEFTAEHAPHEAAVSVPHLVEVHRTPILKSEHLSNMSSVVAAQRYYGYAQEQLAAAVAGVPAASGALYGLGKLEGELANDKKQNEQRHTAQAMVFHQAALLVDSRNYLAGNELGVLLARAGAWTAARDVLTQSVMLKSDPSAWHNLAIVHDNLGESQLADLARTEWQLALKRQGELSNGDTTVTWVAPEQFNGPAVPARTATRPTDSNTQSGGSWWDLWK